MRKINYCICRLFFGSIVFVCDAPKNKQAACLASNTVEVLYKPRSAQGFSFVRKGGVNYLKDINPWQFAPGVKYTYSLPHRTDPTQNEGVQIPIRRAICISTTHIDFIDALGQTSAVYGMPASKLAYSPQVRKQLEKNKVADVGHCFNLSHELIYLVITDS